jgi:hypothetical protein
VYGRRVLQEPRVYGLRPVSEAAQLKPSSATETVRASTQMLAGMGCG